MARLLGGTDKKKMAAVAACYLDAYGKSLVEALKGDLSGTFLKVCVFVLGCSVGLSAMVGQSPNAFGNSLQVTIKTNLLAELKHQAPN